MSSRLRRECVAILATTIAVALLSTPARAADKDPDLAVTITTLTPSWIKAGSDVTMRGTITNNDDHAWGEVQAYLVIPTTPFTTRAQLDDAIADDDAYTGNRVIEPGTFDEVGDLAPGQTAAYELTVPYEQLGISGGAGVYPSGVQVLGTDTDGTRSNDAIGRATTFLPSAAPGQSRVPATVVWPIMMPDYRGADGDYHDPMTTLGLIGPGGQLRNLLDLAATLPPRSSTVMIDPALLVGLDDLANQRHLAKDVELSEDQTALAQAFLQELLDYVRSTNTWVLGFDRPDDLALAANPDLRPTLSEAIDSATREAQTTFSVTGRRVTWPSRAGTTAGLLATERRDGETPVIVTPESVTGWERRLGSIVSYDSTRGPVPLLVNDTIASVPGGNTVVSFRQRILSDAALAGLQRAVDPASRADAVTLVDPAWNPGPAAGAVLADAFSSPFVTASTLDDLMTQPLRTYEGPVPGSTRARPVTRAQLASASDLAATGEALRSITAEGADVNTTLDRDIAGLLGVRWRRDPSLGETVARDRASRAATVLTQLKIEGPPSVTLSSASGSFPLTIVNETSNDIEVGVALESSNPALDLAPVEPVSVAAGERQTLTVDIDLGQQSTTQLTARLVSPDGTVLGASDEFNVRSSRIGAVLWVAIGLAGILLVVAMFRRFHRRRTTSTTERPVDDD